MHAILPRPHVNSFSVLIISALIIIVASAVVTSTLWHRKRVATWLTVVELLFAGIALGALAWVLSEPVATARREYYRGRDQFEWASELKASESERRHQAVVALCELLKSSHSGVRWWCVQQLGSAGAEAKSALPVLWQLLQEETIDDDQSFRDLVRYAIQQIELDASEGW
jgi:hypothetical protein